MVKKIRFLVLTVLCLTAVLVQPSRGEEKEPRCDQKAIQQAKDAYNKWLAKATESAKVASEQEAQLTAGYDETQREFDEVWGQAPEIGFNELTMHTTAKPGSEAAEKLAPGLTILELGAFLTQMSVFIANNSKKALTTDSHALNAAVAHQNISLAYEYAWEAEQRRKALEAQCKKRKPSFNSREESRPATITTVSDSQNQIDEGADLRKSSDFEKTLYLQYSTIHSLLEAASGAFGDAKQAVGNARSVVAIEVGMLPPEQTKTAKLTGPQLAECKKWLTAAFKSIAKAVQNYDQVKSELAKINQLTVKH